MNLGLQQQRGADGIWHDMATQMGSRNNPHVAGVMIDTEPSFSDLLWPTNLEP